MAVKETAPKRRTAPREIRRKQLIMAAIDSIAKRGFSDTTLKHVTERAKLSHGVVNFHFDSKEALYDATLGFLAEEHYAAWIAYYGKAKPTPAHQLAAIISADFDRKICTHKRLAVWFAFWGQAKYRPNYLKIHNTYDNERYDRIVSLCAALIDEGDYTDLDVARTARLIESISDGTWLSLMLYPELNDREACRADCMMGLSKIFPKHFPLDP